MSILRQDVFIQREAEVRAAYQRDRRQLELLSGELLGALSQQVRAAPKIEGLRELLELVKKQHAEILREFSYEAYWAEARAAWPEIRRFIYGYSELGFGNRNTLSQAPFLVGSLSRKLREAARPILHFLHLLRKVDLTRAEGVMELLQAVPEGAAGLRQALQKRLEALKLRAELFHLRERLERVNAEMAAPYSKLLEEAWAAFEREGQLEALRSLRQSLTRKVLEQERLSLLQRMQRQREAQAPLEGKFEGYRQVFRKEADPEKAEGVTEPLQAVPEGAAGLRQALQKRLEALKLRAELFHLRERLERVNAEMAAPYSKLLEEAWAAFEREGQLEALRSLRQSLMRKVLEQERLSLAQRRPSQGEGQAPLEGELEGYRRRGAYYYERLRQLHPQAGQAATPLYEELTETTHLQRARALKDELQYRYQKVLRRHLEAETLKEEVAAVYASFPVERLREEVEAFGAQAEVTQEAAEALIQKILTTYQAEVPVASELREQAETALVSSLLEMLRSRGYQLLSDEMTAQLLQGEPVELRTPYGPDYAIRLRLENGALNMRFIRYVDDESQLSDYEKQKDKEIGHQWCQDYEGVRRLLEHNGIYLHTSYRIEPEEKFYYIRRSEAAGYGVQRQQAPLQQKKQPK